MPKNARTPLSPALICQTALELIQQGGLEQLSMRSLAGALKVDPMAIYHHIPNKGALLHAVHNTVLGELFEEEIPPGAWQDQLKQLARRYRTVALRHPQVFPSLIASGETTANEHRALALMLSYLLNAGLEPQATIQAGDTLFAFVTGFALVETTHLQHPLMDSALAQQMSAPQTSSHTLELIEQLPGHPFSESFEFGLQIILSGIEAAVTPKLEY
ncbi:TetR/AcrR family transcriptional regulator [Deinococcus oregonensis]|uniref:TetR/AcrR family transcriptional regulator n=1 Tax=Deinococcus oregonensis TaxID=1805970 RepID=A0ABV6B6R4_9DEIO